MVVVDRVLQTPLQILSLVDVTAPSGCTAVSGCTALSLSGCTDLTLCVLTLVDFDVVVAGGVVHRYRASSLAVSSIWPRARWPSKHLSGAAESPTAS